MSRQPWMKFFPADWQSDVLLRSCSIAARGLWIELLCIMQKADPVGHLLVNGKAPAPSLLAVLCGTSEKEIRRLLDELRAAGVFDEVEGVIVSRRMVRDVEKAERDKANGKRGGNPAVMVGVNPPVKPSVERGDKAHIPEARSQKNTNGASAPIEPAAPDPFEVFWSLYPKRDGSNPKKPAKTKFEKLVRAGTDPERIIAGARRMAIRHPKPTVYVPQAIKYLSEERFDDEDACGPTTVHTLVVDETWIKRLDYARKHHQWAKIEWGPMPGQQGCMVPARLLKPTDGDGWTAQKEAA